MSRPASPALPRILTIDRVNEPVAEYLAARYSTADGPAPPSPLDVYLIHLLVEFSGRSATAIDLASRSTIGASTIALLSNARVRRVIVEESRWPATPAGERLHETAGRFIAAREPGRADALEIATDAEDAIERLSAAIAPGDAAIALVPASEFRGEGGSAATAILERFPDGLVAVMGLGRPGVDEAVEGLLQTARDGDDLQVRFLRDAASSLYETTTAILARGDAAVERSRRIADLFTTNYDFLTLLRDSCLHAIERGSRPGGDAPAIIASASPARFSSAEDLGEATNLQRILRQENERLAHELREARSWVRKGNPLLIPVRSALAFGRRHRGWFAPRGSFRERAAHSALRVGRRLRGA